MPNTQHTPGPWAVACACNSATHRHPAILSDGGQVAIATFQGSEPATDANARLIAAAPALLDALRTIAANASSVQMDPQWAVQVARAAIAAATEGTPAIEQGFPGRAEALAALSQREDEGRY